MSKEQITSNQIGTAASLATLTAAYSDNVTNKIKVERMDELNLEVSYLAGVDDQFVEILVETSIDGSNWKTYPTLLPTTSEVPSYDNPIAIPGDRVSLTTVAENFGAYLALNHIWIRISVRERTNAGVAASVFGTIHIASILKYEV